MTNPLAADVPVAAHTTVVGMRDPKPIATPPPHTITEATALAVAMCDGASCGAIGRSVVVARAARHGGEHTCRDKAAQPIDGPQAATAVGGSDRPPVPKLSARRIGRAGSCRGEIAAGQAGHTQRL